MTKGDPVEVLETWARGEDRAWFKGYVFDRADGDTVIVVHADGPFQGAPVRYPTDRVRPAR